MIKGKDFVGVCVVYFCHDGKGNFAMHKRSPNTRDEQGRWDVGGGGVELHETVEECLGKEVKEEWGANIVSYEFLGFRDVHRNKDGNPTHWIALDFKVLVDPTQIRNGEPHKFDEIGWFRLDNLPSPRHSQLDYALQKYADKLK
ncbi:MAG: NUDIX domain-containing protein [Candidatus Liptonbacteria bacterium]